MDASFAAGHFGYRLLLMALIIGVNSFFAAAETALVSVRPSKLKAMADEGVLGAQAALSLLAHPERLLSVCQVGLTLASLALGWVGEDTLYSIFLAGIAPLITTTTRVIITFACFALAFAVMTFFHVVAGEVVPKNVAIGMADRLAVVAAPALLVFYKVAEPFVYVIERTAGWVSRLAGVRAARLHGAGHSIEELKFVVSASHASGQLTEFDEESLLNLLELGSVTAQEVMTPRIQMVMLGADTGLDEALWQISDSHYSRLLVYEADREKILGIVHVKDLLGFWMRRRSANVRLRAMERFDLRNLVHKIPVVPETKPLNALMSDLREARSHVALVVDEFGSIAGVITMEDVLEQIFGRIEDVFDKPAEPAAAATSGVLELDGSLTLRDLEAQYDIVLPSDLGFATLAGFLLYRLGRIPQTGQALEEDGRRYTVIAMEGNRIARVRVERL